MKRILLTGGAGFIGSKSNIAHLLSNHRFESLRHDVTKEILLEVDEIYNLACPASPIHYQYNPIKTIKTSVLGAINVLGLAKRVKAKVLQTSTSEVYGDPHIHLEEGLLRTIEYFRQTIKNQ